MSHESNPLVLLTRYWWIGVVISCLLWVLPLYLLMFGAPGSIVGITIQFGWFVAWIVMPVAIYDDIKHIRGLSEWDPDWRPYVVVALIPIVAAVSGAVYLYRRYEFVGIS